MSTVDEIKARIDILDLVSETVQLRRSGKSYTGFCPFHPNTRTPAFVVYPDSGTWHCFGQCSTGGDIFNFVMKKEGWEFGEALHYLAERAGVQLKPPTPEQQAAEEEGDGLRALLEEAVTFYRHNLLNTPPGKAAQDYLRTKRGIRDDTLESFGLGYAPDAWEAALQHFRSRGHSEQDLIDSGLATERQPEEGRQRSGVYDRFRHRIMIPIRDERGRMAGFGARILRPDDKPKFLNSPQTPIFDKSRLLYGLDRARKAIRDRGSVVIVEGYLDVIALHQAGFTNVVSPMGTALTEPQLFLLKKLTQRIVLALDPDAAGNTATLRGLELARKAMDHETEMVFDARGLLRHEARLQADIRVTTLPEGMDPDEVVNRDPKEWERILAEARPVVVHVMETLAAGRDLDDPKVKTEIAGQVLPLIDDLPSPIERDTYRQRLARLLRVDERALLAEASRRETGTRRRPARARPGEGQTGQAEGTTRRVNRPSAEATSPAESSSLLEAHSLSVLLRRPDLLYRVDRKFQEDGLPRLTPEDFQHAGHQTIFRLLQESVDQDLAEPLSFVFASLSEPLMELVDRLLERSARLDPVEDRVLEDMMRALIDVRRRKLQQSIDYLRFLMQEAQEQGDGKASQYGQTMVQHTRTKQRLDRALQKYTSRAATKTVQ